MARAWRGVQSTLGHMAELADSISLVFQKGEWRREHHAENFGILRDWVRHISAISGDMILYQPLPVLTFPAAHGRKCDSPASNTLVRSSAFFTVEI